MVNTSNIVKNKIKPTNNIDALNQIYAALIHLLFIVYFLEYN